LVQLGPSARSNESTILEHELRVRKWRR
jgi:hypothetical protein